MRGAKFLDLGAGHPTIGATHQVVQAIDPAARVVYVDRNRVAVAIRRARFGHADRVRTVNADLCNVDAVLSSTAVRDLFDPTEPIALVCTDVLSFLPDAAEPATILARYRAALAPGSFLVLADTVVDDMHMERFFAITNLYATTTDPIWLRDRHDLAAFLPGWEPIDPDNGSSPHASLVVPVTQWRAYLDLDGPGRPAGNVYGTVARLVPQPRVMAA